MYDIVLLQFKCFLLLFFSLKQNYYFFTFQFLLQLLLSLISSSTVLWAHHTALKLQNLDTLILKNQKTNRKV